MEYDFLINMTDEELSKLGNAPEDSEIVRQRKLRLAQICKEERLLKQEKTAICISMANPEDASKLLALSQRAVKNTMENEITQDNREDQPFKDFSEDEQEFFDAKKYKTIHNLHKKITSDPEVEKVLDILKQEGTLDARKQRHKKKVNDYLGGVVNSKLIADMARRQKEQDERLARLELAQQRNEDKFEQIGTAILGLEDKVKCLLVLGLDQKKIAAWKLSMENPDMTRNLLAVALGKSKPTVINLIQEVQSEISKSLPR
jgi:hypothetical protein